MFLWGFHSIKKKIEVGPIPAPLMRIFLNSEPKNLSVGVDARLSRVLHMRRHVSKSPHRRQQQLNSFSFSHLPVKSKGFIFCQFSPLPFLFFAILLCLRRGHFIVGYLTILRNKRNTLKVFEIEFY